MITKQKNWHTYFISLAVFCLCWNVNVHPFNKTCSLLFTTQKGIYCSFSMSILFFWHLSFQRFLRPTNISTLNGHAYLIWISFHAVVHIMFHCDWRVLIYIYLSRFFKQITKLTVFDVFLRFVFSNQNQVTCFSLFIVCFNSIDWS